jgi:hypothetical protein
LILISPLISAFRNGANPACAAPVFGFTYNPLAPAAAMLNRRAAPRAPTLT